ncbi:uncharacterized protein LOC105192386 [Harpegnathos saltator]|uniref:Uncharacterized protein n=1 Tax=Harpegnathos saltator TaxID=610380 RepID=E2B8W7_HARSA|nr:uncharacterized protein LOC105192386 [Harpegnathos saltator]XP_011154797.1 uncharacterized protein LOC105192386 [Harpegnathos saltator]XP_025155757.1 uncharacterized protein LOC105192386 [Harpegnathos saltator]XP_025155801.1 uncharacterized protein LOC105192386 [Harpegnathos saltator]XP_025155840.1 uncharacterized protein LOC105192386 [Harpegnathos saltator]XP_025155883.1 uncharacterized protein LOC105192386 [Harpegnathos saltator]XP_025155920.1 uncharacterized protein LOC105192386 [Harpeg
MTPKQAEGWLAVFYGSSMVLSVTSIISLVTAWQHWSWTLDSCFNVSCGCILYGINTFNTFIGGDVKLCHFSAYALIPVIVIGLCLSSYHGYRCCVQKNLDEPKRLNGAVTRNDDRRNLNEQVVIHVKSRSQCKQWIPAAFIAALVCCLSLAHAVVLTDGYYETCNQYRRNIIQLLGSRGREAQAIHDRLSCGGIFDFMDYLQPDANNWVRGSEINTGIALQLAISTSWLNFFVWLAAFSINMVMARKRLHNLGEKFCCCC